MFFDRIRDFYDEVVVLQKNTKQIDTSLFVTTLEKPRPMVFPSRVACCCYTNSQMVLSSF